jgi:hypothetical protein
MEVVLVPRQDGKHFIWPGYEIGHKFEVPNIESPVKKTPIQLEMVVRARALCLAVALHVTMFRPAAWLLKTTALTCMRALLQSHSPKVFHVHNFLSVKEADFLVSKAQAKSNPVRVSTHFEPKFREFPFALAGHFV